MREGPDIARIAALVADPARSAMLLALMDGRALTATELARVGGITKQTASGHLAKLVDGDVLCVEAQGRHRYFRLAGAHVAALLEALMLFSGDVAPSLRAGPKEPALRKARICYDHLAGEMGVMLFDCAREGGWLSDDLNLSDQGWTKLAGIGYPPMICPQQLPPLPHLSGLESAKGQARLKRELRNNARRNQDAQYEPSLPQSAILRVDRLASTGNSQTDGQRR